ncbi:hypothetical protein D3C81_834960 [compost metagenome]
MQYALKMLNYGVDVLGKRKRFILSDDLALMDNFVSRFGYLLFQFKWAELIQHVEELKCTKLALRLRCDTFPSCLQRIF